MKGLFIPGITAKMFRDASIESVAEFMTEGKVYDIDYQEPCEDAISRQAAQAKIKSICDEYRLSYEDGERKAATGGSAYALGHAFDDLPPVTPLCHCEAKAESEDKE